MAQRLWRRSILTACLAAVGGLAIAGAAQAATFYTIRPAQLDPLLWVGVRPGTSTVALTVPTAGATSQHWGFRKVGGTPFAPWYQIYNRASGGCMHIGSPVPSVATCQPAASHFDWYQLRIGSNPRPVGLLAYGATGSRVRIHRYVAGSEVGVLCVAASFGVGADKLIVDNSPCGRYPNQEWTFSRFVVP